MPDGTDLFNDVFGEREERQAQKEASAESAPASKKEPASASQNDLVSLSQAKKEKQKRKPRQKKQSVTKESLPIDSKEHRSAIKKMMLQKAAKSAKEETVETEKEDEEEKEEDEASSKDDAEKDPVTDDLLDSMSEDDWMHEDGIHEEGVKTKTEKKKDAPTTPETTQKGDSPIPQGQTDVPLKFLEDPEKNIVFIGRKKSVFKQFGDQAALFVGKVEEQNEPGSEKNVYMDSLNPHVVFVCGARGSGKSYVLGVIAEELALRNKDVGAIVVDPIGVFWSMRFSNKEEKEDSGLGALDLMPQGLENLKVFIPRGIASQVPKSTYDGTFAIQPSLLTVEDWCLTFNIERFSPTGLLMEKALAKVKNGFTDGEGKKFKPKGENYGIDELVYCLEKDAELNSRERGYKQDSIRALVSRFEAAKNWGIFDQKGTPLGELSRINQLTVLDTSFLEDNVTALVIGVLARRILSARKLSARKEAAKRLKTTTVDELLELDIPPTWLFIDEAHTLIPSGNMSTPATSALVEYVKQGRRPGCSLVFATQQPSAIDTRVLSQLDILIAHKLVFDDDIKAVFKRAPTVIPPKYKNSNFIKTLPVGVGLTADRREETTRAFVMRIRPRMSQHEGRDAETAQQGEEMSLEQVESLASEMLLGKLSTEGEMELETVRKVVETLNLKYKSNAKLEKILDLLKKKKIVVDEDVVYMPGVKRDEEEKDDESKESDEKEEMVSIAEMKEKKKSKKQVDESSEEEESVEDHDETELISFPVRISEQRAFQIANGKRKAGLLGLFGSKEEVRSVALKHESIYRVWLELPSKKQSELQSKECFISSVSGELVHFSGNHFEESRGVAKLWDASNESVSVIMSLVGGKKKTLAEIAKTLNLPEDEIKRSLKKMISDGLVDVSDKNGLLQYFLSKKTDLPPSPVHPKMDSLSKVPFEKVDTLSKEEEQFKENDVSDLLGKMFPLVRVRRIEVVYRPFYLATLEKNRVNRVLRIDAVNGHVLQ